MDQCKKWYFWFYFASFLVLRSWQSKTPHISTSFAGPYRAKLEEFIPCGTTKKNDLELNIQCAEYKGVKDCKRITGNVTFKQDLDEFAATLMMYPWRDREWKRDGYTMKFKKGFQACNEYVVDLCSKILRNQTHFSKGVWHVDAPVKMFFPTIPIFPYGRWKSILFAQEQESVNFCAGVILNVVPKSST